MSNQDQTNHIRELADKWLRGNISSSEQAYFEKWYAGFDDTEVILDRGEYKNKAGLKAGIFNAIKVKIDEKGRKKIFPLWQKLSVSAAVVVVVTAALWLLNDPSAGMPFIQGRYKNDIAPGKNMARIRHANGRTVVLSSTQQGVTLTGGVLRYADGTKVADPEIGMETLVASTPLGGTYQFLLSDGSRIWLNAGSSVTFPSNFKKQKRRVVEITGEAYFEVAKDKERPFVVKAGRQELEVLGTHFNINAYQDEPVLETTLLEGSVELYATGFHGQKSEQNRYRLKPNQRAVMGRSRNIEVADVDPETIVAWKNGYFKFKEESIQSVMRKLSRWYTIDVTYASGLPQGKFTGRISRDKSISQVLRLMESGKSVNFKVEGRRVTVLK